MEIFGILKKSLKNAVSLIVKMFVWQVVKKYFNIKDFIKEQDLETLSRLYGDNCDEYRTEVSEEAYNEIPTFLYNCNKGLLAKITSFMLPLHKIKISPSESLCTPSNAEKRLLSLINQFPDPTLPPTSPTPFNFTYTVVKLNTPWSPVDHGCEKKSKSKESTVSSSSLELLNFLEVNTCFTKAILTSEWILFTTRISGWKNLYIQLGTVGILSKSCTSYK